MDEGITAAIDNFFKRLADPAFIFRTGKVWPDAALDELRGKDQGFQKQFWIELEKVLKEKEKALGHIHKGGIYWSLAILLLGEGNLTQAIDNLNRSSDEDRQRGDTFSAAIGLSSILKPLVKRFKKNEWRFDEEIMRFYELLAQEERGEFARRIGGTHDQVAGFGMTVIKDEFFHFIVDEAIRRVVHSSYIEIRDILLGRGLKTYFSCVFSSGSILEGMLDDLFSRNEQEVWRLFRADTKIDKALNPDSRLRKTDYDASLTLGEKIMVLRILTEHGGSPIPKVPILQMLILAEYRDLIHPRRRASFEFKGNWYVAAFIFSFISQIAHHWWPENVKRELTGDTKRGY
jgi:hypothetical protein